MLKILVVGDCHVEVGESIERFRCLGKFLEERKPDIVVLIGDFLTLDCLSSWNENKRLTMEGQRYSKEMALGRKALTYLFEEVGKYNQRQKKNRKPKYHPRFIYIEGNHEQRLRRYVDQHPELEGMLDVYKDLGLDAYKAEWVSYEDYILINGIQFCHIPFAKNGKPAGRQAICKQALELSAQSVVFGHTHKWGAENIHRTGGKHLQQALNVGCFFEHQPDYVAGAPSDYWKGVVMLSSYSEQRFDVETIALSRLKQEYK